MKTWGGPTKAPVDHGNLEGREGARGTQGGFHGLPGSGPREGNERLQFRVEADRPRPNLHKEELSVATGTSLGPPVGLQVRPELGVGQHASAEGPEVAPGRRPGPGRSKTSFGLLEPRALRPKVRPRLLGNSTNEARVFFNKLKAGRTNSGVVLPRLDPWPQGAVFGGNNLQLLLGDGVAPVLDAHEPRLDQLDAPPSGTLQHLDSRGPNKPHAPAPSPTGGGIPLFA